MASKTRFNRGSAAGVIPGGSKKGNNLTGIGSEFVPASAKAPSNVQVIYNGKIVTPVSLLARPKAQNNAAPASKGDPEVKDSAAGGEGTGEAHASEEEKNKPIAKKDSMTNNRSR